MRLALAALVGIWLSGSLAMMINSTLSGGGFKQSVGGTLIAVALGLLPPYTFIMSTYDGTLGALLLVSATLPLAGALCSRKRKVSVTSGTPIPK